MALGRVKHSFKVIIISITAATLVAAVFAMLYFNGVFLPGWIEWSDKEIPFEIGKKVKIQDYCYADLDMDGDDELVVLCWKIGKYGERMPFWVKRDELKWSQHIFIYEVEQEKITPKWMASDIHQDVKRFKPYGEVVLENTSPDGTISYWMWDTWGLYRIEKDAADIIAAFYNRKRNFADEVANGLTECEVEEKQGPDEDVPDEEERTESETEQSVAYDIKRQEKAQDDFNDDKKISILMAGDILLHDGVNRACQNEDGGYDYSVLFAHTYDTINGADIAIVNQEVIIGGDELKVAGYPSFNAPYEIGDALSDAGFDVVCHATNHALDRGKQGIVNCLDYWRKNHPDMVVIGISDDAEAYNNIAFIEKNGVKIAILNYTYGTNGIAMPDSLPKAVALLEDNRLIEDLKYAEERCDFTVVCPHWGTEYRLSADDYQKSKAQFMVENGADLIIGTHPHVIEPVEWVESENGNRALCYYSLGNYVNWISGRGDNVSNRMVGGLADVTIAKNGDDFAIDDYSLIPVVAHVEGKHGGVTTYLLDDYTNELAMLNEIRKQDSNFSLDYCRELIENVVGQFNSPLDI